MPMVGTDGLPPMSRVLLHPQALCALRLPSLLNAWLQRSRLVPHPWGSAEGAQVPDCPIAEVLSLAPSISPSSLLGWLPCPLRCTYRDG